VVLLAPLGRLEPVGRGKFRILRCGRGPTPARCSPRSPGLRPVAAKQQWDGYDPVKKGDYAGSCLPFGFPRSLYGPHQTQIIQDNDHLVMLFEQNSMFHTVPTDGRAFTKDLPASWFGESVGLC